VIFLSRKLRKAVASRSSLRKIHGTGKILEAFGLVGFVTLQV
jgi:hypothetical protein